MRTLIFADSHLNHANIATYCDRPKDFTSLIIKHWNERVNDEDLVIHFGDVAIGPRGLVESQIRALRGRKILIRGNHDAKSSNTWWMTHGFYFSCDSMIFGGYWLTHEPAKSLPEGCHLNIHGHLHNIWGKRVPADNQKEFVTHSKLHNSFQRLLACEYTNYYPVELEDFVQHPDKYQSRGPRKEL
jgi:calcineurin-like phosphoesterase family protein